MKVLALREKFAHMGSHSGYDLLFSELEKNPSVTLKSAHFNSREKFLPPVRSMLKRVLKSYAHGTPYYGAAQNVAAELRAIVRSRHCDLLHVAYLENNYALLRHDLARRYLRGTKIVATAHQPASWWRLNADPALVAKLDALIVLSPAEQAYFETYLPGKVFCIAHGVDTSFFTPGEVEKTQFRCVFSGQWLRDIATLVEVVERVIQLDPSIQFDLIYPAKNRSQNIELYRLAKYDQVVWHKNLSDQALRQVYRGASLLLLPLLDCTANNALLEGMSCGLPVISTDLDAVRFYTPSAATFLYKRGQEAEMAARILSFSKDPDLVSSLGAKSRAHVLTKVQWPQLADQMAELYRRVCSNA